MKLKVKRIHEKAKLPEYAHATDAGMDLYSVERAELKPGESKLVSTGLVIELPENTEAQIRPRSGLALKNQITVLNTPGTIDQGYRGEVKIILINHGNNSFLVEEGMRIAQMVVKPVLKVDVEEVEDLTDSDRGDVGFGSTGVN